MTGLIGILIVQTLIILVLAFLLIKSRLPACGGTGRQATTGERPDDLRVADDDETVDRTGYEISPALSGVPEEHDEITGNESANDLAERFNAFLDGKYVPDKK